MRILKPLIISIPLLILIYPAQPAHGLQEGNCLTSNTVVVTGTVSDPSGIDPASVMVTIDGITPKFFSYDGLSGAWSATFKDESEISDGDHTLLVEATDECGSGNYSSTTINFRVDTEANVSITSPADGSTILSNQCTVKGTADPDIDTVTVDGITGIPVTEGSWMYELTSCPITPCDAYKTIDVSATDACGNFTNTSSTVWVACSGVCAYQVPGAPILIQSLPREEAATLLPPYSVTLNMPTNAYLKFVYNQSLDISGASANIGVLFLEETNYGDDTLVWSATLDYETDYTLNITGVVDCDEGNAAPEINLTLRTARDVVYPAAPADRRAQSGEGFLDGSLIVRVIDDLGGTEITDAVVQINTSVTWDDPDWLKEIDKTDATGSVTFASVTVALNQPITITAMAPGYQYLTFYGLDAQEVILGLRLRGEGIAALQETYVIGDFDPMQFNSVHPFNERGGMPNPLRMGLATFGFYKRTMNTLAIEDILAPNVLQTLDLIGLATLDAALPANLLLPDYVIARIDIPTATPTFVTESFYRLRTLRTGDAYVAISGATANVQEIDLLLWCAALGCEQTEFISLMNMAGTHCDIQRITIPDIGAGNCLTLIVDDNDRGVTLDPLTGCTNIVSSGRQMILDHYPFGWNPTGDLWEEPLFEYDRAVRVNMSNWPDDPDEGENYSARITCVDYNNNPAPCRILTLQLGILNMPDDSQIGVSMALVSLTDGTGAGAISSKLLGLPDVGDIEFDLSLPAGSITVAVATTTLDWEMRFILNMGRGMADIGPGGMPHGQCAVGPCYLAETSEWIPWIYGIDPLDPGVPGYDEPGNPAVSPANDLINRIFEVPELVAADVIDDAQPGVDPEFNSELLIMRLMDSVTDLGSCLEPSYLETSWVGPATPIYTPASNPVWRFYAPPKLIEGGTVRIHLPKVPTVAEINDLGLDGLVYTFESPTQTGVPDGFELEWAINAINLPTYANINNLVERDAMMYDVNDLSQNRQRFIFQKE